jgi:hypothetical protein
LHSLYFRPSPYVPSFSQVASEASANDAGERGQPDLF